MFAGSRSLVCAGSIYSRGGEPHSLFVWCKHGGAEGAKVYRPVQRCTNYYNGGVLVVAYTLRPELQRSHQLQFHNVRVPVPPVVVMVLRELRQVRWLAN
jgi:hypothetical protein